MDKIKHSFRTGSVDLKEVCQKWEEELFSRLIANKDVYLDIERPDSFTTECWDDYGYVSAKITALVDIGIIDMSEAEILREYFGDITKSYIKSKVKEVS